MCSGERRGEQRQSPPPFYLSDCSKVVWQHGWYSDAGSSRLFRTSHISKPLFPNSTLACLCCYRAPAWKQRCTLHFGLSVKHDVAWRQYCEIFQGKGSLNYVRTHLSLTCQRMYTGWGVTSGDAFVDVNPSCEWPLHKNNDECGGSSTYFELGSFHIWFSPRKQISLWFSDPHE